MNRDIYNNEAKFQKRYSKFFSGTSLSMSNKTVLEDFFELLASEGLSYARRYKYLDFWTNLLKWLNKDVLELDKEDLIKLAGIINDKDYKQSTKGDYKDAVKKFYKSITALPKYERLNDIYIWLYDPRTTFFKKAKSGEKSDKTKEEWFTEDDVIKIISLAQTLRDKCWISLLASQGMRPEELLTIRKQDVSVIDNGIKIKVAGKTGARDLFIYESFVITNCMEYIKSLQKDQDYLFNISLKRANDILKDICEKAQIKKRAYLYKLRKFSVTKDRILGLSTGCLEQKYGWIKGTKVISHYDKSVGIDYQKEIQKKYGIIDDKGPRTKLIDKICLRCGEKNPYSNIHCCKCSLRLDITKEELMQNTTNLEKDVNELKIKLDRFERFIVWLESQDKVKKHIEESVY